MSSLDDKATLDGIKSVLGPADFIDISRHSGKQSKEAYREWIKRRLGAPLQRVELSNNQIDDALSFSLTKFVSTAERPVKYWQFVTTKFKNIYPMPEDFVGFVDDPQYVPNTVVNFIQTFTAYQMYLNFTGNLDVTLYESLMEHLQLKINRIGSVPTFTTVIDQGVTRLKVFPAPSADNLPVVYSYVSLPRWEEWTPQVDLLGFTWVLGYALAICKEMLGRVRSKFGDNVVAGDQSVTMDGGVLLGEAKEEMAKLDELLEGQSFYGFQLF